MPKLTSDNSEKFINPYNFVSQNKEKVIRGAVEYGDLTGKITCRLKVKDKLALPDHSAAEGKQKFDFYKIDGKPVVPGSEIKGCIRSVYETVTHSCFSVVNSNVLSSRLDNPDSSVEPGLLVYENAAWRLYSADKFEKSKLGKYGKVAANGVKREWHKWGINFDVTETYYFFKKTLVCELDKEDIEKFDELFDIYISNAAKSKEFSNILNVYKNNWHNHKSVPVFYKLNSSGKFEYLSLAQVSRKMYLNTVKNLLGSYSPDKCGVEIETSDGKKYAEYCPACRLFGTIANTPLNGRISFSDAVEHKNVRISNSYFNLPELSSPKITSVEFYSEFPGRGNGSDRWDYDDEGVTLKGRKYYYHSPAKSEKFLGPRSVATKPALENSEFVFDVYFDKISETELKQLLWVLTLGENSVDGEYLHKLGFGKPVGYGSVKIVADKITLRKIDGEDYGITEKLFDDYSISDTLFDEPETVSQLKQILKYDYVSGHNVSYPIADDGRGKSNSKAAHQWFSSNRPQDGTFLYVLPKISENASDLELPSMKANNAQATAGNAQASAAKGSGSASPVEPKYDTSKLEANKHYIARCTKITAGMSYAEFEVNGEKRQRIYNDHLPRDLRVGQEIRVTCKGPNKFGFAWFWVDR